jgi:hypothetical protein
MALANYVEADYVSGMAKCEQRDCKVMLQPRWLMRALGFRDCAKAQ